MRFSWQREDAKGGRNNWDLVDSDSDGSVARVAVTRVDPDGMVSGFAFITVYGYFVLRTEPRKQIEKFEPADPSDDESRHFRKVPLTEVKIRMSRLFMSPLEILAMLKDEA